MNISCPLCSSEQSTFHYNVKSDNRSYTVEKCSSCGHYYTRFNFDIAEEGLYNDEVYRVIDNRSSIYAKIMDHEYGKVLKQISRWYPKGSGLLDFGSGKGVFLNLARKAGFKCTGVETAEERADFAEKKYGLQIIREMYSGGSIGGGAYKVITLFHVLEHLPDPKGLLESLLKDNLEKDGLLILEVPNLSGLQAGIAKNKWMHLDIPRHLSHFSKSSLSSLCRELNLEIIKTDYFSWHLGVLGMCHSILSLFGYEGKIIRDLKNYNKGLVLALLFVLPLATVLELLASAFKHGGIIRVYCRRIQ